MKRQIPEAAPRNRRNGLILSLTALVLIIVFFSLPVFRTETVLFSKKSANTFVGDEKYQTVRAEVEQAAAQHAGFENLEVHEEVTLRTKSDGSQSSMVTFNVTAQEWNNAWQIITSGLPSGYMLAALLICAVIAFLTGFLGRGRISGGIAIAFALCALLQVPAFAMLNTRTFTRSIGTVLSGAREADISALLASADRLLYGGKAGEDAAKLLGGMTYKYTLVLWALLPAGMLLLCGLLLMQNARLGSALARGSLYCFVIVLCIVILYPYYVMFITGLRSIAETNDMYFLHMLPVKWVWSNFRDIVQRGVLRYLGNSLLLSSGATLIGLICGIPAAYAMARMKFRGKKAFLGFVIMSQMFSPVVLLVGIARLMSALKLNDTVVGLMLINAAFNQAFAIWLLRGTFVSISSEMEQAACIDGCNVFGALTRVLLPMAAPGIVTTLIFVFINAWNEYTISTVLISTSSRRPITVGITQFSSFNMIEWQYLFASALLATIPVVILFLCIEKHLVTGLTSGGVKG